MEKQKEIEKEIFAAISLNVNLLVIQTYELYR